MTEPAVRSRRPSATVRALILDAARTLFAERGYAGATTREIAQQAGTNEVLLFRHFNNKPQLFEQAVFEPFRQYVASFVEAHAARETAKPLFQHGREFIAGLYDLLSENRGLLLALIAAQAYEPDVSAGLGGIEALQEFFARWERYLREVDVGGTIDAALHARFSFGTVAAVVLFQDWLFIGDRRRGRAQLIEQLVQFASGGFHAQGGKVRTRRRR